MEALHTKVFDWMKKHARPLDLAYYQYLFQDGTKEDVILELTKFQNNDGGFGHALEPDNTNPHSTAIQTWAAIDYINNLNLDEHHPLIIKTLEYLESHMEASGFYPTTIESNNDYPHAIWWHYTKESSYWGYNPSVALWAFLYKYRPNLKVKKLLVDALCAFMNKPSDEMHELKCFVDVYEWLYDKKDDFLCFPSFEIELKEQIFNILDNYDPNSNEYGPTPLGLCSCPNDHIYLDIKNMIDLQLTEIKKEIQNKPIWDITFHWGQYEEDFQKAKIIWQSILANKYMKFL